MACLFIVTFILIVCSGTGSDYTLHDTHRPDAPQYLGKVRAVTHQYKKKHGRNIFVIFSDRDLLDI